MTIKVEVMLEEDGSMQISGSNHGEPMEGDDILDCLDAAVFALEAMRAQETLQ